MLIKPRFTSKILRVQEKAKLSFVDKKEAIAYPMYCLLLYKVIYWDSSSNQISDSQ